MQIGFIFEIHHLKRKLKPKITPFTDKNQPAIYSVSGSAEDQSIFESKLQQQLNHENN
jgi:hypothetical protein